MEFDVHANKVSKKRFRIDDLKASDTQPRASKLYDINDNTEFSIRASASLPDSNHTHDSATNVPVSESYIGGLVTQVRKLNMRISQALAEVKESAELSRGSPPENSILLHGFEGTGKSLILRHLRRSKLCNTVCLSRSTLDAATASRNKDIVRRVLKEAKTQQPSLVLIDDINKITPTNDETYVGSIIQGLEDISGNRVFVIATCRSFADVHPALLSSGQFVEQIELPVPDQIAREQVLGALLRKDPKTKEDLVSVVGHRTHGFTGGDLARLVRRARANARDRSWTDANPGNYDYVRSESDLGSREKDLPNGHDYASPETNKAGLTITMEDIEFALTQVRPSALREIIFEAPKTTWADIGGSADIQKSLDRIILWPLERKEDMAKFKKRPKKGVLLYGPPGCSKTLTAQAIATKYGLNFIPVKPAELISMYVGESERAIRDLFRKARAAKPCVIFFDEIDSIASTRDESAKGLNVLTTLLTEMDGFNTSEGVLVLAATNKPEALDPAIMRPGRFDAKFYLGLPNHAARGEILELVSKGLNGSSLDYNSLASSTEGFTGAEIRNIYELATDYVLGRKEDGQQGAELCMADFERATEQTQKGVTPEMIAAYEAFGKGRTAGSA